MKVVMNRTSRSMSRSAKGQAMTEFIFMSAVAFIILFVAIQLAALGRESMALGQLNYQVVRWATNPGNNSIAGSNSPQCSDVANLIAGNSVAPYSSVTAMASGYMGKIGFGNTVCGAPKKGGIGVAMTCVAAGGTTSTPCAAKRPAGTGVQVTLTMDTSPVIFLSTSASSPSFFGIPFPTTLSSTHMMLTQ